ncbi:arsinothricin resistance N-acetyltransferase ArsN1 family B [Iodidimonas sp. SYSU 1G8]|uniref:arsinothricin resistance N-acetyltransferase ArsN1 family B n=1 Tax=Iodidimonas sp. SYSU 1G8 TaxID=3133967 RepID=UPI0031FEE666
MPNPLGIRLATAADAVAVRGIYAPIVENTVISFENEVPTVAEMARRIETAHAFFAAERDGTVIGYAYASPHRERAAYRTSVDVSVYIDKDDRQAGVGTALYGSLLPHLKRQGYHAAFAGIALPNEGSVALHERVGFSSVGIYREVGFKFDKFHDVGWWQMILR